MIALPALAAKMARDAGAEAVQISSFEGDWFNDFKRLARIPADAGLPALPRVHVSPPEALVRLHIDLAQETDDLAGMRLALFAVYCKGFGSSHLTLRNAARKFSALASAEQAPLIRSLLTALGPNAASGHDVALVNGLAAAASEWLQDLSA